MAIPRDVQDAMQAHIMWKARLRTAIHTGQCDATPDEIRAIDRCAFGKWIHGGEAADSLTLGAARAAHARFHEVAADVCELARDGRGEEARRALAAGGAYEIASSNLLAILQQWEEAA